MTQVVPRIKQLATTLHNPDRVYYNGWSEGDGATLLYRDERGKRYRERVPVDWYFILSDSDKAKVSDEGWSWVIKTKQWAQRVVRDDRCPGSFWRVYVENKVRPLDRKRVFERIGDPEFGDRWCRPFTGGESPRSVRWPQNRDRWTKLQHLLDWCLRKGLKPLEADLSPLQRFLVDRDIRVQERYHVCFFDFETDDSVGGFERKERNRILSVAWEGSRFPQDELDQGYLEISSETDDAERALLLEFRRRFLRYDVLAAWNGDYFDFPMLIARFHHHRIPMEWRKMLFVDPLPIFRRHFTRAAEQGTSFALDSLGEKVLKKRKVDWRTLLRESHPHVAPKVINLYRHRKDVLQDYNRQDARLMRELEVYSGFVHVEQLFCRISRGFVNEFGNSAKIDRLMLRKGAREGVHFPTRFWAPERPEKYQGAFVFDPVRGLHRNVAAFDFKSLYPSMMCSFNISPETLVKREARENFVLEHGPGSLCRCPEVTVHGEVGEHVRGGATFRTDHQGFVSQMFRDTLERRREFTDLMQRRLAEVGSTEDDTYRLYFRLAYAYKQLGLSFYGDLGSPTSRYYDVELAEAVTLSGRHFVKLTASIAEGMGYRVIYGDTDSCYVQLFQGVGFASEEERVAEVNRLGEEFLKHVAPQYVHELHSRGCNLAWNTVQLEFEDVYDKIFFTTKKRYAGRLLSHKGARTDNVDVKGLEVMRSDTSRAARELQRRVMDAILMRDLSAAELEVELIEPEFRRCVDHLLPLEDLVISKSISKDPDEYKVQPLHVRLAQWVKEHDTGFHVGMKVGYVVTGTKPKLDGVLAVHFDPEFTAYDAAYYWDNSTFPPTQRVLEVVFPEHDWTGWLVERRRRREALVERYRKWLVDPKRVAKALQQIRENKGGLLGAAELARLHRLPKVRLLAP